MLREVITDSENQPTVDPADCRVYQRPWSELAKIYETIHAEETAKKPKTRQFRTTLVREPKAGRKELITPGGGSASEGYQDTTD